MSRYIYQQHYESRCVDIYIHTNITDECPGLQVGEELLDSGPGPVARVGEVAWNINIFRPDTGHCL